MLKGIFKQYEDEKAPDENLRKLQINVIGCGGGGTNSINRLNNMDMEGVTTIALNTDGQHLYMVESDRKLLIGERLTGGHGAGGDPRLGKICAEEA
ncbi:MAG: cell division protein FtsZ, partial [Candidatus Thermoplasmatota archaeon]|nr:cell division protein FtsZ [Candidatus Thermoplasmatota archaeon]